MPFAYDQITGEGGVYVAVNACKDFVKTSRDALFTLKLSTGHQVRLTLDQLVTVHTKAGYVAVQASAILPQHYVALDPSWGVLKKSDHELDPEHLARIFVLDDDDILPRSGVLWGRVARKHRSYLKDFVKTVDVLFKENTGVFNLTRANARAFSAMVRILGYKAPTYSYNGANKTYTLKAMDGEISDQTETFVEDSAHVVSFEQTDVEYCYTYTHESPFSVGGILMN